MGLASDRKEVVINFDPRRRKLDEASVIQRLHLVTCSPDSRAGCDIFWAVDVTVQARCGQRFNCCLVNAHHAAKRALDEVQLILQDEVRTGEWWHGYRRYSLRVIRWILWE
jgi:hypothetical protein